jgi:RNA polymerase sigma-70 factor (ECF subfamily)
MDADDKSLLNQAATGDEHSFELLVTRYQKLVYFAAYRLIHNHDDADDVLQETFIRLYTTLQKRPEIENLVGWLYRTSVNLAIDKLRQMSRHKESPLTVSSTESEEPVQIDVPDKTSPAPDEEVVGQERRTIIRKAIDLLPLQEKTVTILHDLEGLKLKEIAAILDCAEGTVKATLYHAHRKLRQKLLPLMLELRGEAGAKVEPEPKLRYTSEKKQSEIHAKLKH